MNNDLPETETVGIIKTVKNKKVIGLLKNQGKNMIEFPEITIRKIELDESEKNKFVNIGEFDWLIFTDLFTVDFFLEELAETGFDLYRLDEFKICACGEAVSDKLRFAQIHSDVIPARKSPENIFDELLMYASDEADFFDSKFLLLKGQNKNELLTKFLVEKKLNLVEITNYSVEPLNSFENAKYKSLLSGGAIERFIFTSPEDWESLNQFGGEGYLTNIFETIEIETMDEVTEQTLRENILK